MKGRSTFIKSVTVVAMLSLFILLNSCGAGGGTVDEGTVDGGTVDEGVEDGLNTYSSSKMKYTFSYPEKGEVQVIDTGLDDAEHIKVLVGDSKDVTSIDIKVDKQMHKDLFPNDIHEYMNGYSDLPGYQERWAEPSDSQYETQYLEEQIISVDGAEAYFLKTEVLRYGGPHAHGRQVYFMNDDGFVFQFDYTERPLHFARYLEYLDVILNSFRFQ